MGEEGPQHQRIGLGSPLTVQKITDTGTIGTGWAGTSQTTTPISTATTAAHAAERNKASSSTPAQYATKTCTATVDRFGISMKQ